MQMTLIIPNYLLWLFIVTTFALLIVFAFKKARKTFTEKLKIFTQISPIFWATIFLSFTVLIWTNGGAISMTSETMSWKTIAALITSEISIGFLVAWILIYFVDKPAKEEAAQDFTEKQAILSQNIFQYLYGVELPDELFKHIEDKILKTPFYRRNYTIDYNFIKKVGERYLIKVNIQCDVYNLTDQRQTYSVTGGIERPHSDNAGISQPLGLTELFINNTSINAEALKEAQDKINDTTEDFRFQHDVDIPPKGSVNIKITLWMTKWSRDYEIFRVLESSGSVKMNLIFSESLSIKASPIHPNGEFSHRNESENSLSVEMDYPLSPQNGILLWWGDNDNNINTT